MTEVPGKKWVYDRTKAVYLSIIMYNPIKMVAFTLFASALPQAIFLVRPEDTRKNFFPLQPPKKDVV